MEESAGGIFHPQRIRSSRLGAEIPSKTDMLSATVEPASGLPRSLTFTASPFESDVESMGPGEFSFYVSSPSSATIDLIARIFDVAPDGTETEVTIGVMRISGLSFGETRHVIFRDFGDDWIFRRGHSLRIRLTNIDFPDFRPPGDNDNLSSTFTLRTGKKFPSSLRLFLHGI